MTAAPTLALTDVRKRFRTQVALAGARLTVRPGTLHALLGENGAGKSTLMHIAYGLERPDAGAISRDGRPVTFGSPADAIAAGIGMVHQHYALVPAMTVAENVALGGSGRYDARSSAATVRRIGEATGLTLDPHATVASLGVGAQQRLEIVKALVRDARLLILDEPTAVLAPTEAAELLRWLRAFADRGGAAVLITHKLREALSVADDVTVLRRGATVLTTTPAATSAAALALAMTGDAAPTAQESRVVTRAYVGDVVLTLDGVGVADRDGVVRLRDVTGEVRGGEIVGVAGVEGSGQRELLRVLAGRVAPTAGVARRPPTVGFVPEDRHHDAVALDFTLTENVALNGAGARRGLVRWRELRERAESLLVRHDVRATGVGQAMGALSGGNQQKLVMGRELAGDVEALVVENPTRGLDVRASAAVHAELRRARDRGAAVVVYASDLDEVLALADRVWVAYAGTVREVAAEREVVGRAITGAA